MWALSNGKSVLYVTSGARSGPVRDALRGTNAEVLVSTVSGGGGVEESLDNIECIVCSHDPSETDAIDVLDAVREEDADLPFVLVTDEGSEDLAAEAIENDASAYLREETIAADPSVLEERVLDCVERYRERRREERLAREHELVAEVATDVFWTVDLTTGDLRMSDGIARFGYDPEGQYDHEWWVRRIHPDDRDRILAEHEAVTTPDPEGFETFDGDRREFENEFRWQRADGSYVHVRARGLTRFEEGEAIAQIGTMTDVTDRKERERNLELLETLLDYAHDAVYVVDADTGEILRANRAACEQLGYDCETLVGMPVADISTSHEREATWRDETPDLDPGETFSKEDVHRRADGTTFPVELSVGYAEIEGRRYHIAVVRDITSRKERERELELVETLVDHSNDEVYVVDAETGTFERVNRTAREHLQYAPEELVGEPVTTVSTHFDDLEEWRDHIDELRANGGFRSETSHVRADGTTYPVEVSVSYVEIEKEPYVVTIARDISERKERERRLTRQNERLKEFASILSHDLRNPLNVAQGNLELAREECNSPYLEEVATAHDRMQTLIDDLLALTRQDERSRGTEAVSLAEVAEKCWRMVETRDAELVTETTQAIQADPGRLKELLENLFRNAIEHGGEDVRVTVGDLDDGFYVADDGRGIPEADRDVVFDAGVTTNEEGTGFGLYIVEWIADVHDWEVGVTDSATGGARFEFRNVTTSPH